MTTKNVTQLKKVTGMTAVPFVSAGVTVDENISGHVIDEDGLTALVEQSFIAETVPALQDQLKVANDAKIKAEGDLKIANTTITTHEATIKKLQDDLAAAEEGAAGEIENTSGGGDAANRKKVPFHESSKDPSNAIADSLFGAPVEKAE